MVQARQVAVYAQADRLGLTSIGDELGAVWAATKRRHRSADGWAFSVTADGVVADPKLDLYTYAFVIFACSHMYALTAEPVYLSDASETLEEVATRFQVPPGYVSARPDASGLRLQNPHMHLLEAALAMAEVSGQDAPLETARGLINLFDAQLTAGPPRVVRETYDAEWRTPEPRGENLVEPGHQFEWAWLLKEFQRLTGEDMGERVRPLLRFAIEHGVDRAEGSIRNAVRENGAVADGASRLWTHTEAIRCLAGEAPSEGGGTLLQPVADRLAARFLAKELNGGWYDRLKADGTVESDFMPASTLYHVVGAIFALRTLAAK